MASKKMTKAQEKKSFQAELIAQLVNLSTSGFGLAAALAWNNTIQEFVKKYIEPTIPGSGLQSQLLYALLVTLFAVLVTYNLSRVHARLQSK